MRISKYSLNEDKSRLTDALVIQLVRDKVSVLFYFIIKLINDQLVNSFTCSQNIAAVSTLLKLLLIIFLQILILRHSYTVQVTQMKKLIYFIT